MSCIYSSTWGVQTITCTQGKEETANSGGRGPGVSTGGVKCHGGGGHMSTFCYSSLSCLPRGLYLASRPLMRKTHISGGGRPSDCELSPLTSPQRSPGQLSQVMGVNPLWAGGVGLEVTPPQEGEQGSNEPGGHGMWGPCYSWTPCCNGWGWRIQAGQPRIPAVTDPKTLRSPGASGRRRCCWALQTLGVRSAQRENRDRGLIHSAISLPLLPTIHALIRRV